VLIGLKAPVLYVCNSPFTSLEKVMVPVKSLLVVPRKRKPLPLSALVSFVTETTIDAARAVPSIAPGHFIAVSCAKFADRRNR